jgi:TetR/AcrR family transcriptional repressor of nem operon
VSNKDEALRAAAELFHRQGFRNTSVDQVLEACGISKSNFYYHFKSKEDLGFAVLEKWIEGYGIHMLNEVLRDENLAPPARLEKFFSKLAALIERSGGRLGCPFGTLSLEMSDIHEGFRTRLAQCFEEWAQALEACLEQGKREGVWS